jgi:hypothetical protein
MLVTRAEAAALTGLSPRQFDDKIKSRLEKSAIVGSLKKLRYDATAVVAALVAYRLEQNQVEIEEESIAGSDSPHAERIREYRADLLEMERDNKRAQLIPRNQLEGPLGNLAMVLRNAIDMLARRFGNDAAGIMNDAINEAEAGWEELATASETNTSDEPGTANAVAAEVDGGTDPVPETSNDQGVRRARDRAADGTV